MHSRFDEDSFKPIIRRIDHLPVPDTIRHVIDNPNLTRKLDRTAVLTVSIIAVLVPLVMPAFQPNLSQAYGEYKTFSLHFGALVLLGLLLTHWISNSGTSAKDGIRSIQLRNLGRLVPADFVLLGLIGIVIATLISSAFSPVPKVSFLGKSAEFTGFSGYDITSLFIIFLATKTFFKSSRVLNNLLVAIAISGTIAAVYGLLQHFGWDPIGGRQGSTRIPATFGNSLNFGGFLVMTIPLTLAISLNTRRKIDRRIFVLVCVAAGSQLAAVWFTGGRGPFIGITSGLIALIALVSFSPDRALQRQTLFLLAFSALVATFLILIPASDRGFGLARISSINDELAVLTDTDVTVGPGEGGLKARLGIWETALGLAVSPVVPQSESQIKTSLRRIYGLGPEMFIYSYPLATTPKQDVELQSNVHNISLHIVVTLGLLGLSALLITLFGLLILVKTNVIRSTKATEVETVTVVLLITLTAAITGKIVELQSGVPRVSDLTPLFVIVGALLAAVRVSHHSGTTQSAKKRDISDYTSNSAGPSLGIKIATSALLMIFATALFISWDVRRLRSTLALPANNSESTAENGRRYLRGNEVAPEKVHPAYSLHKAYFEQSNSALAEGRFEESRQALLASREMWLEINRHDPYDYSSQMALAKIAFTLFERGAPEFAHEAVTRYENIAARFPNYPTLVGTAATVAASTENYAIAISLANQAIETEPSTKPWSKAWFARGISLYLTEHQQDGIDDLVIATQKEPGSQAAKLAHLALVKIYTDAGDTEAADAHREQLAP